MSKTKTRVRLIDVAEKAKVSRAAVARVLLGTGAGRIRVGKEKAELIKKIAEEMNFQPDNSAQMLAGKNSKIIGVLIDSYAPQVRFRTLSVAEEILAKEGFRLMIGQTHNNYDNFKSYIADFASRRVDAIICFAHEYPNFDVSKDFEGFKNVVFVGKPKLENANFVDVDIKKGIEKLVKHLAEKGRKKIGFFHSGTEFLPNRERINGYKAGLTAQSLDFNEKLLFSSSHNPQEKDYIEAIEYLRGEQKVDAIIANNDFWAVNLIKYMKRKGIKIPEDVAVTGFDNMAIGTSSDPEVTTVDPQSEKQGEVIAELILKMMNGKIKQSPQQIVIEPELKVRKST